MKDTVVFKGLKKYRENKKNSGTLEQLDQREKWLKRLGLWELVCAMIILSEDYNLPWAESWCKHLDDPEWLRRALAGTFAGLTADEKDLVVPYYEEWMWFERHFDMKVLVEPEFNAVCYLLDRYGRRVRWAGEVKTVLVGLKGQDRREALLQLNTKAYEFKCWW